jgi:hypothetical protein
MAKVKIQGHASGTGVITVTAPNTSTDRTITLPDATGTLLNSDGSAASLTAIPAAQLTGALPAISGASLTGVNAVNTGRKNMLYNGAMNVWQRGTTSLTGVGSSTETYMADRFKFTSSGDSRYTLSREADAPAGFKYSYKFDCTTVGTSTGTSRSYLEQGIEGQDLQHLQKGLATAKPVTLSFWVKTVITGVTDPVFRVNLQDANNTRILGGTYTYDTSTGGWQKFTITFVGDTTGAITDNANKGMFVEWWLYDYGYYSGGSIPTSWESQVDADRNSNSTGNVAGNTSNYWQIAGVQLELGSVATDFEHRSYGEELALCQRYYQRYGGTDNYFMLVGNAYDGDTAFCPTTLQTRMRAAPTFATSGTMSDYRYQSKSGDVTPAAIALDQSMEDCVALNVSTAGGALTAGHAVRLMNTVAAGYFEFIAEL